MSGNVELNKIKVIMNQFNICHQKLKVIFRAKHNLRSF